MEADDVLIPELLDLLGGEKRHTLLGEPLGGGCTLMGGLGGGEAGFPAKAALEVLRGLLVGRPVVELGLDVVAQHLRPGLPVHGVKLGKRLHRDPEGDPAADNGGGVVREARDGRPAGFIDQKEHRAAPLALGAVIGRDQLVDERAPQEPHQGRERQADPAPASEDRR